MITDQDITKLKKVFATKEDLADLKIEVGEIHDKIDTIQNSIDGLVKIVTHNQEEHAAGAVHLYRHDRQIETLAIATGVTLPE